MIIWRYILRAHIGPFLFSNATIIFLFLLQFMMKTAGELVGKGLSGWVITELVALNLAWMIVLSVPMSVLVATLMAFGGLSSTNEIVIMRASGVSLYRMIAPVLFAAILLTLALIKFNNDILPEANIRLRTLMSDVMRIKPTLSLSAGVFTSQEDLPSYRILVRKTFRENNNLEGVTIYDLSRPDKNVVLTAQYGVVSFTPDYSKLIMDLRDGEIHEMNNTNMIGYRRIRFVHHRVTMSAEGFGFTRSDAEKAQRDDRTMSAKAMRQVVDSIKKIQQTKKEALVKYANDYVDGYLKMKPQYFTSDPSFIQERMRNELRKPKSNHDLHLENRNAPQPPVEKNTALQRAMEDARQMQSNILSQASSIEYDEQQMDKYLVEIYKKYSIPFACIVFVLIGAPLGIMARRGGFGIGAGLSLGFFLLYWACLIGGEKLADRDITSPFVGMWIANIIIGILGIFLTIRSARETLVIDWSAVLRFVPKRWRIESVSQTANPFEA